WALPVVPAPPTTMPTAPDVDAAVVITAADGAPVSEANLLTVVPVTPAFAISERIALDCTSTDSVLDTIVALSVKAELTRLPVALKRGITLVVPPVICVDTTVGEVPVPPKSPASWITPTALVVAFETVRLPVAASRASGADAVTA